mmetsp:Transcript_42701/g.76806  ORF Transcript_42701/g.76806 Transcript_42701/m.76806 type:complete len:169 (-) Transcript_42701:216-722(-)
MTLAGEGNSDAESVRTSASQVQARGTRRLLNSRMRMVRMQLESNRLHETSTSSSYGLVDRQRSSGQLQMSTPTASSLPSFRILSPDSLGSQATPQGRLLSPDSLHSQSTRADPTNSDSFGSQPIMLDPPRIDADRGQEANVPLDSPPAQPSQASSYITQPLRPAPDCS